jgi:hypothetical protein
MQFGFRDYTGHAFSVRSMGIRQTQQHGALSDGPPFERKATEFSEGQGKIMEADAPRIGAPGLDHWSDLLSRS